MKLISSEKLLETPIFSVTQDRAIDPDGFEIKRAIVQHGGSAVMMPVDEKAASAGTAVLRTSCTTALARRSGRHLQDMLMRIGRSMLTDNMTVTPVSITRHELTNCCTSMLHQQDQPPACQMLESFNSLRLLRCYLDS